MSFLNSFIAVIGFVGLVTNVNAQRTEQAISLNNGSLIRGTVLDISDTSKLKLLTNDGSIWVFERSEVKEVKTVDKYNPKAVYNPKSTGFYNITDIGLLFGRDRYYSAVSPSIQTVSGYRFNPNVAAGIGVGVESYDIGLAPVFAEVRYVLLDARFSPFVCMQSGYAIPLYNYRGNDGRPVNKGGLMFNVGAGFKHSFTNHLGLIMTAGYRHQQSVSEQNYWWFAEGDRSIIRTQYNRFVVRLGLLFS